MRGGGRRLFAAVAVTHLLVSGVLLVVAIGGAVAAHEGEPDPTGEIAAVLADVLLAPIVAARWVLPEAVAPGFGLPALIGNGLPWAAAVTGLVRLARARRDRR